MKDGLLAAWLAGVNRPKPAADDGSEPPPKWPGWEVLFPDDDGEALFRFPIIEKAAKNLFERRILTRPDFDRLDADARRAAFTIARTSSLDALQKVQEVLVQDVASGGTLREFRAAVDSALGESAFAPGHVENIYRTNVAQAYSAGLADVLTHPLVADEFPYLAYYAIHDDRVDPDHLAMETLGLQGTNIYRRDDPVWQKFFPPWRWNCRCMVTPMSLEDAAAAGVREAMEWLRTGEAPVAPAWVQPPPFNPPPGWAMRPRLEAMI